ncbi:MAG: large conductance mechanosensitive channel protein MscL [Pseudomonadota bacterium]
MLNEFKEFAIKGNVVDMGVGIVIGAAFTTIVTSFVEDIINPIIGLFTGGVDFSNLFINLSGQDVASAAKAKEDGLAVITYGNFINALIAFLIVAWVLFLIVKAVNNLKKMAETEKEAEPETPPEPSAEEKLLTEIRDLLAKS